MTASRDGKRPTAVVARDPRASGEFIAAAVEAGLASSGIDVYDAGVLPTPAAAYLVADLNADFGVMISASHNPAPDNGIKFFARGGQKLPDEVEDAIEAADGKEPVPARRRRRGTDPALLRRRGPLHRAPAADPARTASTGLKVVLDCAHGAASGCSPQVFKRRRRRRYGHWRRAGRPEHQRRRGLHPPGARCRPPSWSTAQTWASPTTATPTAAWPWTTKVTMIDGDQIMAILAARPASDAGQAQGRRPGGHRDEQPRPEARPARRRHQHRGNRGGRPLRAGGTCATAATSWAASSPAT